MALGSAIHKRSSCEKCGQHLNGPWSQVKAYPKWAIPTSHSSIVLQDVLFSDTSPLLLPIPFVPFEIAMSKTNEKCEEISKLTVDPGGIWWPWNIIERGSGIPSVQGVNCRGCGDSHGCVPEVAVTHEVGNPRRTR
jgi:hypothetical protein